MITIATAIPTVIIIALLISSIIIVTNIGFVMVIVIIISAPPSTAPLIVCFPDVLHVFEEICAENYDTEICIMQCIGMMRYI